MYFNNRYMSGGREVENVTILPNKEVIVTFGNAEGEVTCMCILNDLRINQFLFQI